MKKSRLITSLVSFILLFVLTFYVIFSKYDINDIVINLKKTKLIYLFLALILLSLYYVLQAIYMKILFKSMDVHVSFIKCCYYAVVEFFFSGITPGSTGGQPVQLYFMRKDKIPVNKSMIVLIFNTLLFKLYLLIGGILVLIFKPSYVFETKQFITVLFFIGLIYDLITVIICNLLMYNQKVIRAILNVFYKLYARIVKKEFNRESVDKILAGYLEQSAYIKSHKKESIIGIIVTFLQRSLLFSMLFLVYLNFNQTGMDYFSLLFLQINVQLCVEGILLPGGGTGVNELVTNRLFITIFGIIAPSAMILNRTLTFYIPLILSLIIVILGSRIWYAKKSLK